MIRIKYKRWFIQFDRGGILKDRYFAWASKKPCTSPLDLSVGDIYFEIGDDPSHTVSKLKAELDELDAQAAA